MLLIHLSVQLISYNNYLHVSIVLLFHCYSYGYLAFHWYQLAGFLFRVKD